jgi:pimeloyl-ACP methyl ester carboxylesterase
LKWGRDPLVEGLILLSPPLHRAGDADLDAWGADGRPVVALIPEFDDYLRPAEAKERFKRIPQAEVVPVENAKHLWVGEPYVRIVLNEIVKRVAPGAYPLPTEY